MEVILIVYKINIFRKTMAKSRQANKKKSIKMILMKCINLIILMKKKNKYIISKQNMKNIVKTKLVIIDEICEYHDIF